MILKESAKDEAHQDKDKLQSLPERSANASTYRFPSVESVLDDIDAFLETCEYMA